MIVSLRGPSGSGKTHVVYDLLHAHDPEKLWKPHFAKGNPRLPRAFRIGNLYIIGRYSGAPCSGADGLYPLKDIVKPLVEHYAKLGLVIVEGLVLSSAVSLWQEISDNFPGRVTLAFLDTPIDKCIARIYQRNGGKPIQEYQVRSHHKTIQNQRRRFSEAGVRVETIDHTRATVQVVELLHEGGWDESA